MKIKGGIASKGHARVDAQGRLLVSVDGAGGGGGGVSYTTSEQDTGLTWHDGRTVFQKTILVPSLPNSSSQNTAHGITGLDELCELNATFKRTSPSFLLGHIPHVHQTTVTSQVQITANATNITIQTASNLTAWSAAVTLRYVKT